MDVSEVHTLVDAAADDVAGSSAAECERVLVAVRRLMSWCEARQVGVVRRLGEVSNAPSHLLAGAGLLGLGDAERVVERAEVGGQIPIVEASLDQGRVTAAHVDVLARALRRLDSERERERFRERSDWLTGLAEQVGFEAFRRAVDAEVRRVQRLYGEHGTERLARQRLACRLRSWVDPVDGMWRLRGQFDPVTGLQMEARLQAVMESLFRAGPAEGVVEPADPGERHDHRRARALIELVERGPAAGLAEPGGAGDGAGVRWRPETVIVLHTDRPEVAATELTDVAAVAGHLASGVLVADTPSVQSLPPTEVAALVARSRRRDIELDGFRVRRAPGRLRLRRERRVASHAQRLVLRAWHQGCVVPGCAASAERCRAHHVRYWQQGGETDVDNLIPVCERHHHAIHDDGWQARLGADRAVLFRLPDGTTLRSHPPPPPHRLDHVGGVVNAGPQASGVRGQSH